MRKSLDFIVIPTGGGIFDEEDGMYSENENRTRTAVEHKNDLINDKYFIISGYMSRNKKEIATGQTYSIYKFLRKNGIKPFQMMIEGKSHDTLQNVVYTLKKLKDKKEKEGDERPWDVAFVSYPGHLKRIEDFVKQAERKGLVNKGEFIFHKIPTGEDTPEQIKYENNLLRKIYHQLKLVIISKYKTR